MSDQTNSAVFDKAAFLDSFEGDEEVLQSLAKLFLTEYRSRLSILRRALVQRDCNELEAAAHLLKGSAAYFAAHSAFSAATHVEEIAQSGDLASAEPACTRLEQEVIRLAEALRAAC